MSSRRLAHTSTPDYTMGYSPDYISFLTRIGEQKPSRFPIPHLAPGHNLLDVGCGPGSLSIRLADAVAPGELFGVDIEPSQIDQARRLAEERGCGNATFQMADVVDLPFEDDFFDMVHCGTVLTYVPDTSVALEEVKRVLRPGGRVACRDMIVDSCFIHPELGLMQRGLEAFADLVTADDGHPQMGKDLKFHLQQAGFTDVAVSASFDVHHLPEEIAAFHGMIKGWLNGELARAAKAYGAATDGLLHEFGLVMEEWRSHPAALVGIAFGHALAVRP